MSWYHNLLMCLANRYALASLLCITIFFSSSAAYAQITATIASDDFSSGTYSGGSGWLAPWDEDNNGNTSAAVDGNAADNPNTLLIRNVASELRFDGVFGTDPYIFRRFNAVGSTSLDLDFDLSTNNNLEANDQFEVRLSSDGGVTWVLAQLFSNDQNLSVNIDILATLGITAGTTDMAVRFGTPLNVLGPNEFFFVDDVSIIAEFPTVVTIGSVNIEPVSVSDFLSDIGASQMTDDQLLTLLTAWDSDAADNVGVNDIVDALNEYLDPDGDGQVALLIWDTLEERGTIGFFVERKTEDGSWVRINDDMLPGLITAPMGGEYRLVDPGAQSGSTYEYQLIEQEATGKTNTYGPFQVEMQ